MERSKVGKAVVVKSLSLSPEDWAYLSSLAIEVALAEASSADPAREAMRATTTQAVRYLIGQDRKKRRKDATGNPLFNAGQGQQRVLNMSTGTTSVQTSFELDLGKPAASKKGPRR
jgi:hypothetical protein